MHWLNRSYNYIIIINFLFVILFNASFLLLPPLVLREGEAVVQSHVVSEQTKLSSVVSVMADHKKRQPKNFRFPLPGKVSR